MRAQVVVLALVAVAWLAPTAHGAAATRILYLADWTGQPEVFAVDPSGTGSVAQLTHWHGACPEPPLGFSSVERQLLPSPDGRYIVARCGSALWLMRSNGEALHVVAADDVLGPIFWARDSKRFVYAVKDAAHMVDAATARDRVATPGEVARLGWDPAGMRSPDRRWVASVSRGVVTVTRAKDGHTLATFPAMFARWAPQGARLAFEDREFIRVYEPGRRRLYRVAGNLGFGDPPPEYGTDVGFGLAWAPDGRRIAYITGKQTFFGAGWSIASGDLMTATLHGPTRTAVARDRAYGGRITAVAWTSVPKAPHYAAPEPVPLQRVTPEGLLANGRIDRLAADGHRVAFIACNRIVVWTPSTGNVDMCGAADPPGVCGYAELSGRYYLYDLALAGDRVAYALSEGCNSIRLTLFVQRLDAASAETEFGHSGGYCGGPFVAAVGRMAGSGDLLVFGQWHEESLVIDGRLTYPVSEGTVRSLDGASCPCATIASTFGPLYPADVDAGRVVVYGTNHTLVLDRDGNQLLSLPVSPQAAQLAGNDLVLVVGNRLRHYDVHGAAPLHDWPLPDSVSGPVCAWLRCDHPRLVLTDVARGLVAYIVDGRLHVLRLADGADSAVGYASDARFMDEGLVYADGARLRLIPFTRLPLR